MSDVLQQDHTLEVGLVGVVRAGRIMLGRLVEGVTGGWMRCDAWCNRTGGN